MTGFLDDGRGKSCVRLVEEWVESAEARAPQLRASPDSRGRIEPAFKEWTRHLISVAAMTLLPELDELKNLVEAYYGKCGPPILNGRLQDAAGIGAAKPPPIMLEDFSDERKEEDWLVSPLPEHFARIADVEHTHCSPGYILYWIATQPFLDTKTGLQFQGPNGIRLGVLLILRVLVNLRFMRRDITTYVPLYGRLYLEEILLYARQTTLLLNDQILTSLLALHNRRGSVPPPTKKPAAGKARDRAKWSLFSAFMRQHANRVAKAKNMRSDVHVRGGPGQISRSVSKSSGGTSHEFATRGSGDRADSPLSVQDSDDERSD
ncbi:hypothetical protein FRC10_002344 [Ceratobasidium sp. 414]|nr:hypothetical protein FRC10_002344 [Ceratobasidium sp. 414]